MMITIFSAVEQVFFDGVVEKAVRTEFYTTREAASTPGGCTKIWTEETFFGALS